MARLPGGRNSASFVKDEVAPSTRGGGWEVSPRVIGLEGVLGAGELAGAHVLAVGLRGVAE